MVHCGLQYATNSPAAASATQWFTLWPTVSYTIMHSMATMCYTVVILWPTISYIMVQWMATMGYTMVYSVAYNKLHYSPVDDYIVLKNGLFCGLQ